MKLMNKNKIKSLVKRLETQKTNTIILEPREVFNQGIIGYDESQNKLIYSYHEIVIALAISYLKEEPGSSFSYQYEAAEDWVQYNTLGTFVTGYPIIRMGEEDAK